MEDEGNVSLLPPSDIEIKKEQLEMLDSSAIKAVPIQAIPAQATKVTMVDGRDYELPMGWLVEQRPRTSLKYLGKVDLYCHEVKTRKRFRSLKAAKNWIMEANQGEQAHEPLEAGDGSN
ncbi:unnamed protein product [Prunus armeniaca]|uniref:MBD domain-containing protein n=1 Tax=Prunus armeniaca TaxID=36596 RepID=A0A6J5XVA3_PRUAR|nr:unnamed protein product [Prunus armeniaca]